MCHCLGKKLSQFFHSLLSGACQGQHWSSFLSFGALLTLKPTRRVDQKPQVALTFAPMPWWHEISLIDTSESWQPGGGNTLTWGTFSMDPVWVQGSGIQMGQHHPEAWVVCGPLQCAIICSFSGCHLRSSVSKWSGNSARSLFASAFSAAGT